MLIGLVIAFFVVVADQLSKYFIYDVMTDTGASVVLAPYLNIVSAFNKGVSFSMFNDGGVWGRVVLILVALAIIIFLLFWLKDERSGFVRISLGMIIGGAVGNLLDRLRMGAVYDFLDFHYGIYHWPAFNVADSFICLGAFFIICHVLFYKKSH